APSPSGSCASRRCTSSSARTQTPSRTHSRRTCPGSSSSRRTTSSADARSSTCRSAGSATYSWASRWRTASFRPKAARSCSKAGPPPAIADVSALADERQVAAVGPAAGVAGIEIAAPEAEHLLRRVTDLDLEALPAVGAVAHVQALVVREAPGPVRLWFPQEYAD